MDIINLILFRSHGQIHQSLDDFWAFIEKEKSKYYAENNKMQIDLSKRKLEEENHSQNKRVK